MNNDKGNYPALQREAIFIDTMIRQSLDVNIISSLFPVPPNDRKSPFPHGWAS